MGTRLSRITLERGRRGPRRSVVCIKHKGKVTVCRQECGREMKVLCVCVCWHGVSCMCVSCVHSYGFFKFFFFRWYSGLNSGLCTCKTGVYGWIPTPTPKPNYFEIKPHYVAQVGLELSISLPQAEITGRCQAHLVCLSGFVY
jgi:hypothetical protein